jgi:hypothetical protein
MIQTALKNSGIDPNKPRPLNPEGAPPDLFGGPPPFGPGGPGGVEAAQVDSEGADAVRVERN